MIGNEIFSQYKLKIVIKIAKKKKFKKTSSIIKTKVSKNRYEKKKFFFDYKKGQPFGSTGQPNWSYKLTLPI